jgi:hypothetical protein
MADVFGGHAAEVAALKLDASDVITCHSYDPEDGLPKFPGGFVTEQRPIICTEWMSRPRRQERLPAAAPVEPATAKEKNYYDDDENGCHGQADVT